MAHPDPSTRLEPAQSVKSRIDRAAIHLFGTHGVDATAVPRIADQAGVAVGSIYRHYANKGDMVKSLYLTHYADLARTLDAAVAAVEPARDKIATLIAVVCALLDRDWALGRFLLMEQHGALVDFNHPNNPVDTVYRVIRHGLETGEIRPMPADIAASFVIGPIIQLATFKLYGRFDGAMNTRAPDLAHTAWAALGADGINAHAPIFSTLCDQNTPGETV